MVDKIANISETVKDLIKKTAALKSAEMTSSSCKQKGVKSNAYGVKVQNLF